MVRLGHYAASLFLISGWTAVAHATPAACQERLLPSSLGTAAGGRAVTPRDLVELRDFGTISYGPGREPFSLSPDGRFAALTLRRADADHDDYCVGILLVPVDGHGAPRLLDVGGQVIPSTSDVHGIAAVPSGLVLPAAPAWAPDGKSLAFLRRDGAITQIWRVALDGSPARRMSSLDTEPLSLAWGPGPNSVLFTTRRSLKESAEAIEREGRRGFLYDSRFWTIVDTRPHPSASLPTETNLLDLASGQIRVLSATEAAASAEGFRMPQGASVYARSQSGAEAWTAAARPELPRGPTLLQVDMDGVRHPCSAEVCRETIVNLTWQGARSLLIVRAGTADNGGRTAIYRWEPGRQAAPVRLLETGDWLTGCLVAGETMLCAREGPNRPRRLVRIDMRTGASTLVFDPNPEFAHMAPGHAERISWTDKDGVRSYGDLVLPPSHHPGERHPLVVVQYLSRGFLRGGIGDEFPIHPLAAHGFAVLSVQVPRESPEAAAQRDAIAAQRVKVRNWSGRLRNFVSLDAGIDAAIARGVVDPEAIAITGISDGGSTLQYALNHSSRFKAAIMGGCCDEPSGVFTVGPSYGASAAAFGYPAAGEDGRAFWLPQSLALNASRMRVPLLLHIADNELRFTQETYTALKSHGAPVEMYVFPDEWHTKAHPAHRLAIYERNIAWLGFWLRGVEFNQFATAAEIARWKAMRDSPGASGSR